jgi:hypothetical protein
MVTRKQVKLHLRSAPHNLNSQEIMTDGLILEIQFNEEHAVRSDPTFSAFCTFPS